MSCRHIIGVNITHNNVFLSIYILTVLIALFRKVSKEFHLDYDKLEDRPSLPTNLSSSSGTVASSGSGVAGVGTGNTQGGIVHQPSSNSPAPPGMPGGGGPPHPAGGSGGIPPSTPSSASQHSPIGGVVAPGLNAVGGGPNL